MKNSRDLFLLVAVITACAAGSVAVWSHRQFTALNGAREIATQQHLTSEKALRESTALVAQIKSQLLATQGDDEDTSYEQWSRQQEATRGSIANLRRRLAAVAPAPHGALAPLPALAAAAEHLHELSGKLESQWNEFEQRGSGLTPASREFLANTLRPLLLDDLDPALNEASAAEAANAEHLAATFSRLAEPARRIRAGAGAAILVALGFGVYALATRRRGPRKLLAAAWQKSSTDEAVPVLSGKISHNDAALDRTAARILLAVADEAERTTLSTLLTNAGYAAVSCDRHQAAKEALEQLSFSLVVLDTQLPGGDVCALLEDARRRHSKLPAILITTANASNAALLTGGPANTQTVQRPINPRTLLWNVSEILYPEDGRTPNSSQIATPSPAPTLKPEVGSLPSANPAPVEATPGEVCRRPVRRITRIEQTVTTAAEAPLPPPPPSVVPTPAAPPTPEVAPASAEFAPPPAPITLPVSEELPAAPEAPATSIDSNSPIPRKRMVRRRTLPQDGA